MWQRWLDGLGRYLKIDSRYFVSNGCWSVLGDGGQLAVGLVVSVLFARLASKEVFGEFQLLSSIVAVMAVVSLRGFDTVVLRDAARGYEGVYGQAAKLRLVWGLLAIPVAVATGAYYVSHDQAGLGWSLVLSAVLLPIHYVSQSWQQWRRGRREFGYVAKGILVRSTVTLLFVGLAIWQFENQLVVIWFAYLATQLLVNVVLHWRGMQAAAKGKLSEDWKSYGYFLSKSGLIKIVGTHADKLVVGLLISPAALAVYVIAVLIPSNALLVQKSLMQTVAPKMGEREYVTFYELWLALLFGLGFLLLAQLLVYFLVPWLYGEEYLQAVPLGLIAAAGVVFQPVTQLLLHFIQVTSRRRAVLLANTLSPVAKIVLLLVFGSLWQTYGIAVVFALMSAVWGVLVLSGLKIDWQRQVVT